MTLPVDAWSGLKLIEPVLDGNRNEVWRASRDGREFAVRRSRRSEASLQWELELMDFLDEHDFVVPAVVSTDSNDPHHEGIVVQRWIDGRTPTSDLDWSGVASELKRLHAITKRHRQRPGCCTVLELAERWVSVDADLGALPARDRTLLIDVLARFDDVPTAVVHGDPGPSNLRITDSGSVGLLDWDESRVDVVWHDLSNLGVAVLDRDEQHRAELLSHAWEAANGWTLEPDYAARRFAALGAALPRWSVAEEHYIASAMLSDRFDLILGEGDVDEPLR